MQHKQDARVAVERNDAAVLQSRSSCLGARTPKGVPKARLTEDTGYCCRINDARLKSGRILLITERVLVGAAKHSVVGIWESRTTVLQRGILESATFVVGDVWETPLTVLQHCILGR